MRTKKTDVSNKVNLITMKRWSRISSLYYIKSYYNDQMILLMTSSADGHEARNSYTFRRKEIPADKVFRRTKFSAPALNFGSFVRRKLFIRFLSPHTPYKKKLILI